MQTFLPYNNFAKSAQVLDMKRLCKQRVEAYQILLIITGNSKTNAWANHPAVLMWKGYEGRLYHYLLAMCDEWISRGYKDTIRAKAYELINGRICTSYTKPNWLGNSRFHRSHKSNLLRKKPEHYSQFNWNVPDNLEYVWPVRKER